jgi:large subunit ribosomal protein L25
MSKQVNVNASKRSELGSRANKRLRDSGKLPGVIYGHKQDVVPIVLTRKEMALHIAHGSHLFALSFDGHTENVLIKEVQFDHLGIEPIHVDFARVDLNEKVTLTISLELKGEPKGEKEGGVLQQIMNELEIECLVTDIPDVIIQDVSHMGKDEVLHVRELKLPPGVKVLDDAEQVVAQVREIVESAADAAAAEGSAEPEVIGQKEREEKAADSEAPAKK